MAFNRSGQHLWFGQELTLRRSGWNSNRIECQRDVPRNDRGIHQIRAVAAGAKYVLAANRDGCLDLHDEETAEWLRSFEVSKQSLFAVALSRDETLAVTGALDGEVSILTLPDGPEVARLKAHVGQVNSVAISPDNRLLATAGADGRLRLWLKSATTWEPLTDLPTGRKPVRQIHLDAAGEKLYVLLAGERGVRVWDLNELRRAFAEYGVGW